MTDTEIDWQPIETAPKNGTVIKTRIPGHGSDNTIAWEGGLFDRDDDECGGWFYIGNSDPPECWTDGICWAQNENDQPSVRPTHWTPIH